MISDRLTRTLLALTFATGIVDAVCFLALGQVFAAMQSGNVIFLGLGISGTAGAPLLAPLISIAAYLAGSAVAALIGLRAIARPGGFFVTAGIEILLLAGAAIAAAVVTIRAEEVSGYLLIAALALAMGLRTTLVRQLGRPNVPATVLNLTLTGLISPASWGFARGEDLAERLAAFSALLAGALAGALLLEVALAVPIAVTAAITLAASLAYRRASSPTGSS